MALEKIKGLVSDVRGFLAAPRVCVEAWVRHENLVARAQALGVSVDPNESDARLEERIEARIWGGA
jgi:hypothetical protein